MFLRFDLHEGNQLANSQLVDKKKLGWGVSLLLRFSDIVEY